MCSRQFILALFYGMIFGGGAQAALEAAVGAQSSLPAAETAGFWSHTGTPTGRARHVTVWTGRELIVWGGLNSRSDGMSYPRDAGRYDPEHDRWVLLNPTDSPSGRLYATAVWTGREMIVWGGVDSTLRYSNSGARYNPSTDTWTSVSSKGAPGGRGYHTAVWTGSEMIIWGGVEVLLGSSYYRSNGAAYNPETDTWREVSSVAAPAARARHFAVWTGTEMLVWGGSGEAPTFSEGGRYNPVDDSWRPINSEGGPSNVSQDYHTGIWTGTEMILWGQLLGENGARYNPLSNSWREITSEGAPTPLAGHTAIWTGTEMLVWGRDGGGRYDPVGDVWTSIATNNAPSPRTGHGAAWTGAEMLVWGGIFTHLDPDGVITEHTFDNGGRFDPRSEVWTEIGAKPGVFPRSSHEVVWTGEEMIVCGGSPNLRHGARFDPVTQVLAPIPDIPGEGRFFHSAVWAGDRMIVWGGFIIQQYRFDVDRHALSDGWEYDRIRNEWLSVPTSDGLSRRCGHTAVWTGKEMLIWGGSDFKGTVFNNGARYDPESRMWTPISTNGAPLARFQHTAVWTGNAMIVWGGSGAGSLLGDGASYHPETDSWTTISVEGAPSGREAATAIWTGTEMVIWGGLNHGLVYFGDGGRYNPVDNRWHPVSALGSPDPRAQHTAVWTGEEMIVWGGQGTGFSTFADGGRYNPELDRWVTIAPERSPMARSSHTAVWTGSEMIVAGGSSVSGEGTAKRGDYAIYNPRLPHLTITREVTGSAKVEWPFPSSAFQLQETREVAAPRWNDVEVMPLREETNWSITVPSTNSSFFRLRQR